MAVALGLRAALFWATGSYPAYAFTSDSPSYIVPAQNLRYDGTFSRTEKGRQVPELYRTPGYSVFLLPFLSGDHVNHRAVQWAQAVLNSMSAGLVYLAVLQFWRNEKAALAAGLGMAFDYVNAIHCLFILPDIFFVFALSLVLFLLAQRRPLWAGLVAALAAFIKPIGLYYPGVLLFLLFLTWARGKQDLSLKRLALFSLISFLPLTVWMQRNHRVAGRWTFTTIQDDNLYEVRTAMLEMERTHLPYAAAMAEIQKTYLQSQPSQSSSRWAVHYLAAHAYDEAKVMVKDAIRLLSGNSIKIMAWAIRKDNRYDPSTMPYIPSQSLLDQAQELRQRHPGLGIVLLSYLIFLGLAYGLALIGFWTSWRQKGWEDTLLLSSSIFYFAFLTLGVYAQARYRLPIMPAIFFFAAGGWQTLYPRIHAE